MAYYANTGWNPSIEDTEAFDALLDRHQEDWLGELENFRSDPPFTTEDQVVRRLIASDSEVCNASLDTISKLMREGHARGGEVVRAFNARGGECDLDGNSRIWVTALSPLADANDPNVDPDGLEIKLVEFILQNPAQEFLLKKLIALAGCELDRRIATAYAVAGVELGCEDEDLDEGDNEEFCGA